MLTIIGEPIVGKIVAASRHPSHFPLSPKPQEGFCTQQCLIDFRSLLNFVQVNAGLAESLKVCGS
jgi:hypothetical protein